MQFSIVVDSGREYLVKHNRLSRKLTIETPPGGKVIYNDPCSPAFKSPPDEADYVEEFAKRFVHNLECLLKNDFEKWKHLI